MVINTLRSKIAEYYKSKDALRLSVLRYYLSKVKNREIELRPENKELDDEAAFKVLRKQVKDRKKTIELFKQGKREDLVNKETKELEILREFAALFPFELDI